MVEVGEDEKRLLEAALRAMKHAYVLWGFKMGAAVLGDDEKVFEGCNVESWVSGLGTCAERCAINHAVLHGNRRIKEMAIVMDGKAPHEPRPCGACLQYIHDFSANSKIKLVMAKAQGGRILAGTVRIRILDEMFPFPYRK
jgi:cytidine deaminase